MSQYLIEGLPERLTVIREEQYDEVFAQTKKLFLVGSKECIQLSAERMNFPPMFNNLLCLFQTLTHVKMEINGELKSFPICADITFVRRPQDTMIVALATCSSMVCHRDIFEKKLIKLFPYVSKDIRLRVESDAAVESRFFHWCTQEVDSRKPMIDMILKQI